EGLAIEDVERRPGDPARAERLDEGGLVDDRTPRSIDEERRRLHARELARADVADRARRELELDRDDVALVEESFVVDAWDTDSRRCGVGQVAAPRDDVHAERASDRHEGAPEVAEPEDAERLAREQRPERDLPAAAAD